MNEYNRVKELLIKYNIEPKKSFGQNFLINDGTIKKIISSFDYSLVDDIIEIGPGLGALTNFLITKKKKFYAIDSDKYMIEILNDILDLNLVHLIQNDFLKTDINSFSSNKRLIIGNLPYNITSSLIEYILEKDFLFAGIMVQKEVGDKLIYIPSKKENTPLGLFLACGYIVEQICLVDHSSFYPAPKVDSTFLKITKKNNIPFNYYQIFKSIFKDSNKTIKNNLKQNKNYLNYLESNLADNINNILSFRARQLNTDDALLLANDINNFNNSK